MILIGDSGSTKCDWQVVDNRKKTIKTSTKGINPFFHDEATIKEIIQGNSDLLGLAEEITQVFIYCAGGSNCELNKVVEKGLNYIFINAKVTVDHDLLGAAFSTYKGDPTITCILGTGSNSIYFDGEKIKEEVPSLAYILGDEGSGSYFGKILLRDYLYHKLPSNLDNELRHNLKLTKDEIFENVYRKPNANVYLASFMKLIHQFKESDYLQKILIDGMENFLRIHVMCYPQFESLKTNFIGSVGFHFQDELKIAANNLGVNIGEISKKPIDGLVNYHLNYSVT